MATPSSVPQLPAGECGVWWADPGAAGPLLAAILSGTERERWRRFRFAADRAAYLAAHALTRIVAGGLLGIPPRDVRFASACVTCGGAHGKPKLPGGAFEFSITHSRGRVGVAFARELPVGIDVEDLTAARLAGSLAPAVPVPAVLAPAVPAPAAPAPPAPAVPAPPAPPASAVPAPPAPAAPVPAALASTVLAPAEQAALASLPEDLQGAGFLRYWTRKEAVLKATGHGLSISPDLVTVTAPGDAPALVAWTAAPALTRPAYLHDLEPGPAHVAALAILGGQPKITEHDASWLLAT